MTRGMLHRLIDTFMGVAERLGVRCSCNDAEHLAIMVFRIMSYKTRQFHSLEHVFGFLESADAQATLAAIFHDLVYYQVDDGFQKDLQPLAALYVEPSPTGVRVHPNAAEVSPVAGYCMDIFAIQGGAELTTTTGLNEFLSALVFAHLFQEHLPPLEIVAVLVCIEASIPFRKPDAQGRDPFELLYARILELGPRRGLVVEPDDAAIMVKRAVTFANKDVDDFCNENPGKFLAGTWQLLPELNAPLRNRGCYTIKEYRTALAKMRGFFGFLDPQWIFHSFRGYPDQGQMYHYATMAEKNLDTARTYLDAKLLSVALIEAIAETTGGDVPVSLFLGDFPEVGVDQEQLVDYLDTKSKVTEGLNEVIINLLKHGRKEDANFDKKNSPLTYYLYQNTPVDRWIQLQKQSTRYFKGEIRPQDFLLGWDPGLLRNIISACSIMVPTRKEALVNLSQELRL